MKMGQCNFLRKGIYGGGGDLRCISLWETLQKFCFLMRSWEKLIKYVMFSIHQVISLNYKHWKWDFCTMLYQWGILDEDYLAHHIFKGLHSPFSL